MSLAGGARESAGPRRFLLATAVSRYPKCPDWDRPGLVEACDSVIELFTTQLGYRHQTGLGLDPTRGQLTDRLRAFCRAPDRREDDLLTVYIAGHGEVLDDSGEHVLFTSDTDPQDIAYTALPTVELARTILRETRVRRLLLVLDTCYSGQGGNELAAAALERIGARWGQSNGSGFVVVSSALPHQQAGAGVFPRLLNDAVASHATAGHGPDALSVSTVVQQMNDHPDRPGYQRVNLALIGLTGEPPAFLSNPRHSDRLTDVDLAVQEAAEFDEYALRRDTELTKRLLVRAMGYHGDAAQGWWFCGRHQALSDLAGWLSGTPARDGSAPLRIVTAGPGSGKTAVLGMIAALTHPERRPTVPLDRLELPAGLIPDVGVVDVAMYAQNLTDTDVLHGLAAAAKLRVNTVGDLVEALGAAAQRQPFTALIDALDEAATPDTLCSRILRPLLEHSAGRIRLLLGTRPYLLDRLGVGPRRDGDGRVIDLDHPRYADPEAVQAYTVRNLVESNPRSPYRHVDPARLRLVAEAVSEAAGASFLVARITAGTLAAADGVPDPWSRSWRDGLPRLPGHAMRDDLTRRLGQDAQRAGDLLRPLAFAEGQGLPWESVWAPLASLLAGRAYTDADLLWLRRTAGSYVVEATENDRSAYRLYHQALTEYLRDGVDRRAAQSAFVDVLISQVPYRGDATRDWSRAHPYALAYLGRHAAAAGRLDELLSHPDYLVHAVPRELTPQLHHAKGEAVRLTAAVYRASVDLHSAASPGTRRQVLALDAARAGADTLRRHWVRGIAPGAWTPRWATGDGFSPALRDTLTGHRGSVNVVACTRVNGGPVAVTASSDSTVRVWDLGTGSAIGQPLSNGDQRVRALTCALVDEVPVAITGGHDGTLRMWDLTTHTPMGEPLKVHSGRVSAMADTVVAGAPVAVVCGDDTLRLWDLAARAPIGEPVSGHEGPIAAVACTTVDTIPVAVTVGFDGTVRVWDLSTLAAVGEPLTGHDQPVLAVACTMLDGRPHAVTAGFDGTLRLWDLTTMTQVGQPFCPWESGPFHSIVCTTVGGAPTAVAGALDGTLRLWDLTSQVPVGRPLAGHNGPVRGIARTVLDDQPAVVTGGNDQTLRVWDLTEHLPGAQPPMRYAELVVSIACVTLDGQPMATTGNGEGPTLRLWNLNSGTATDVPFAVDDDPPIVACTMLGDRPVAITNDGSESAALRVWDIAAGTPIGAPVNVADAEVFAMACAVVDGKPVVITCGDDPVLRLWDLTTGAAIGEVLIGDDGPALAIACTTVGGRPTVITGDGKGNLRWWDLTTGAPAGEPLAVHQGPVYDIGCGVLEGIPTAVTVGDDQTVRVWNLRTRDRVGMLKVAGAFAVALGPEGHLVVGMGRDIAVFTRRSAGEPAH